MKNENYQKVDESIIGHQGYGLVQLYHGHGKGKTTAGLGIAMRAVGAGKKVAIIYFDKGGSNHYSERVLLDRIDEIDYFVTGRDRIDPLGRFDFHNITEDRIEAKRGLKIAEKVLADDYNVVILDEINSTVALDILDVKELLIILDNRKHDIEVILTGRNPVKELIEYANLITEMVPQKHYFYSGVKAREGLDF